ncbi:MAG TPA: hypothetical protein VLM37_09920 [Fibrobacteraceae bacterium]|nr:hypothetical protein [Fibrobacteraceae bacterium]
MMRKSLPFYLLSSSFQVFRRRLEQELMATRGISLDDCTDNESLYRMYQHGEPDNFILASLCRNKNDELD